MVRSLNKERMLGIVPRFRESDVDHDAIATLEDVFRQFGHRAEANAGSLAGKRRSPRRASAEGFVNCLRRAGWGTTQAATRRGEERRLAQSR